MILPGHGGFNGGEVVANALQTQLANTVYHYIGVELTTSLFIARINQDGFNSASVDVLPLH